MIVHQHDPEVVALELSDAPPLADDAVHPYGDRLSDLLQGQQEVMGRIFGSASLQDVLDQIVVVCERSFAPATCVLSLFHRGENAVTHQAALRLPSSLRKSVGTTTGNHLPNPTASSILSGERIIVADFRDDDRWAEHAELAVANGFRSCWVEPVLDCGEGLAGFVTLYYPEPREPNAGDAHVLWALKSFVAFVVHAARRESALRAERDRFSALVSAIPGVVYQRVVSTEGDIRYTYISESARNLFGVSADEILADPEALFRTHSPEYKAKFRERLLAASRRLDMWDVEATLIMPDGRKRYTHALARPDRQEDGSVLWTGIILDETRTREAILDGLSQGFLLYDAQDKLVMRNSHYLTLYPRLSEVAVPGAAYDEVVRAEFESEADKVVASMQYSARLRERLERHNIGSSLFEQQLGDEQWILIAEQRTGDGGTVILYTDISEMKRREQQLQYLALHDPLTGLPNRTLFGQRIEQALKSTRPPHLTTVVMCIDVDHFKAVNDSFGHAAGDALLKCIADRLRASLSETDTVARLGGDEFGIVITDAPTSDQVAQLASRILHVASEPVEFNGHQLTSGISIGIASSCTDGDEPEKLLTNADLALYRAKAEGRGMYRFFQAEMDARAQARRSLEMDLRQAIKRQQFELHYQPQIDLDTNEVVGFEALLRWHHPEKGMISPVEFIPIAEETGLISSIGEWVLRQACLDARNWPASIRVAVNVSPAQFRHQNVAQVVRRILADTDMPASRLEIEITESVLLRDVEANLNALRELKDLGIRVSMDDFGTGYSSLANLRSFPFDKLKIDRSFIFDLENKPDSLVIVRAVLGLSRSLGIATCAEGVETREQLRLLRSEGCKSVQGYYYSRPKPVGDIPNLLQIDFRSPPSDTVSV